MGLSTLDKRECVQYLDGEIVCYRDGWWYTTTGIIVKWSILAAITLFFTIWFVGGYIHAKARMRKGLPLLSYHRFLVPYADRRAAGQVPQNTYAYYAQPNPYAPRTDGSYPDAPPMYSNEAPPGYMPPPGATKTNWTQGGAQQPPPPPPQGQGVEMGAYPPPQGQQNGVARDEEQGQNPPLPDRPQQAKVKVRNLMERFRR